MPEGAETTNTVRRGTAPEAFGASYETEVDRPEADFDRMLERNYVAGAWMSGALVGTAGYYTLAGIKEVHRGHIWGVFVQPAHRGAGVARALIEDILAHARQHVLQVHLSAVASNRAALALYERLGFVVYGIEPRSLRIGDRFFDEHLMVKRLDDAPRLAPSTARISSRLSRLPNTGVPAPNLRAAISGPASTGS